MVWKKHHKREYFKIETISQQYISEKILPAPHHKAASEAACMTVGS